MHLLKLLILERTPIHQLKRSPFAPLLTKPIIKHFLTTCADGCLDPSILTVQSDQLLPYRLNLDVWGEDLTYWDLNQTSRKGVSLVLQLNLSGHFRAALNRTIVKEDLDPLRPYGHPARGGRFPTLAWCRMDLDLDHRVALIEEIQSDLIRDLQALRCQANKARKAEQESFRYFGADFSTFHFLQFYEETVLPLERIWSEAMLTASLRFLMREIGIGDIYYHTPQTGAFLKRIEGPQPPRSLYTQLPRKFCFAQTSDAPERLIDGRRLRQARKRQSVHFYKLAT